MQDFIAKGIAVILSIALLGYIALSFLKAEARVVDVKVIKETQTTIRAEVVKIPDNTEIDIKTSFTAQERANAKSGLALSEKESKVLDDVLSGGELDVNDLEAYLSVLNTLANERELSSDEVKYVVGLSATGNPHDAMRYFSRKRVKEQ